jgi:Flp pilus assembly protein TadG
LVYLTRELQHFAHIQEIIGALLGKINMKFAIRLAAGLIILLGFSIATAWAWDNAERMQTAVEQAT